MAEFNPAVGTVVPVELPDELVRATVVNSSDKGDNLVLQLDVQDPMVKTHGFRRGEMLHASRKRDHPARASVWVAGEKVKG